MKKYFIMLGICGLVAGVLWWSRPVPTPSVHAPMPTVTTDQQAPELAAIRTFAGNPDLALTFIGRELPQPYFRVGRVTKMGSGENMDPEPGWEREVNVYEQQELVPGTCSVYQYHVEPRSHTLTAVIIRGLKPAEIETRKAQGSPCTEAKPERVEMWESKEIFIPLLARVLPDFDSIRSDFVYTAQNNGESHEWTWEDKAYQLPEGLSSRPYPRPIIRIAIYGKGQMQYWNTRELFK